MLYIFLVNNGTMMTFDMNLAIETVENLKVAICEQHQIPINYQVLLISGGESLNSNDRVCKYSSAGTDTSPIFLFCKNQMDLPPSGSAVSDSDEDMRDRVESCLQMEPNYNTVVARNEMAKQLYDADRVLFHACDKLVHDQHLQQQGWAAVVANLEDIVSSFKNKAQKVEYLYSDILQNKALYFQLLEGYEKDKEILAKIPILKCLYSQTEDKEMTLLDWILQKDSKNSLDELYCWDELEHFDKEKLDNLRKEIESTLKNCCNTDMKEIKGIEQRLYALDKLMNDVRHTFDKQGILTQGFSQNQNRISEYVRDHTILPDLCQNHKEQLQSMLTNHNLLVDHKNRCLSAKRELSLNLHQRLRWIIHVEEQLKQNDEVLVVVGLKLQKLRTKLEIIQNLHFAPITYLNSIVEVLRRKCFSDNFHAWAKEISAVAKQLIDDEVYLRKKFFTQLENHFLKLFFPGMNDLPCNFIDTFVEIDHSLPPITSGDVEFLRNKLPALADILVVPSSSHFAVSSSGTNTQVVANEVNLKPSVPKKDCSVATSLHSKDITHLESARAELLGKLTSSDQEIARLQREIDLTKEGRLMNWSIAKQCSSNLTSLIQSFKIELADYVKLCLSENVQSFSDDLSKLGQFCQELQNQALNYKNQFEDERQTNAQLEEKLQKLEVRLEDESKTVENLTQELLTTRDCLARAKHEIEQLSLEKVRLNNVLQDRHTQMHNLKIQSKELAGQLGVCKSQIINLIDWFKKTESRTLKSELTQLIEQLNNDHARMAKEIKQKMTLEKEVEMQKLRDQLNLEHKNELESLRHRFKLAISTTSIERTSSETSLEKVQLDIVDQCAQEREIQKLKSMLNEQKAEYDSSIVKLKSELEVARGKQTGTDLERKLSLSERASQAADTFSPPALFYDQLLSQLTSKLSVDVDNLDSDKCKEILLSLKHDIGEINRKLEPMNTRSFISIPNAPESPVQCDKDLIQDLKHLDLNIEENISFNRCEIGDTVLVYYDKKVDNFVVYLSLSNTPHYIHADSLKECDISKDADNECWIAALVTDKEYCQIKKEGNRYKLPLNQKFYRVKIKQISKCSSSKLKSVSQMNRSYMPPTSSNLFSNIMSSLFGSSFDTPVQNMSRSYTFDANS